MQRKLQLIVIITVVLAMVLLLGMILYMQLRENSGPSNLRGDLHAAMSKPVDFVKSRMTGGVGAILTMNSNNLPEIRGVTTQSPAESAGLQLGDVILSIQGKPTKGMTLAQVVNAIRGFTGGNVTLNVQRLGSTNSTFVIRRESWNAMGLPSPSANSGPATPMGTNGIVIRSVPAGTN